MRNHSIDTFGSNASNVSAQADTYNTDVVRAVVERRGQEVDEGSDAFSAGDSVAEALGVHARGWAPVDGEEVHVLSTKVS